MENNNKILENSVVSSFSKNIKLKIGGEEEGKLAFMRNDINDIDNNPQDTKERIHFLFPNLPPEDINRVLEKSENNIEKATNLIIELKMQNNKMNSLDNHKKGRGLVKRNYITVFQQDNNIKNDIDISNHKKSNIMMKPENKSNIMIDSSKENENINYNNNDKFNKIIEQKISINNSNDYKVNPIKNEERKENTSIPQEINSNKINNQENNETNETNNNYNSLDENTRNLINEQLNFLLNKFREMTDESELKNLLKEIGFPETNENNDNNEKDNLKKLEEELKGKVESNLEERKFIKNQYNKYNNFCKLIKQKEEKIDELTSSLANLIDAESEQKMREEEYKNELIELIKMKNQNQNFNNPREGY